MKAVLDLLRLGEAGGRNLCHARVEIAGDGLHGLSDGLRNPVQDLVHDLGLGALNDRDQGAVLAVTRFVREDGVELPLTDRDFIQTQMGPHVFRKDQPLGGMRAHGPSGEVAEVFAVLPHKPLGVQEMGLRNRGQRQGLVVSLVLLKKPQTPTPIESPGQ